MQFNFVVSSNERAVQTVAEHGIEVVGRLPEAFKHTKLGLVGRPGDVPPFIKGCMERCKKRPGWI